MRPANKYYSRKDREYNSEYSKKSISKLIFSTMHDNMAFTKQEKKIVQNKDLQGD